MRFRFLLREMKKTVMAFTVKGPMGNIEYWGWEMSIIFGYFELNFP